MIELQNLVTLVCVFNRLIQRRCLPEFLYVRGGVVSMNFAIFVYTREHINGITFDNSQMHHPNRSVTLDKYNVPVISSVELVSIVE